MNFPMALRLHPRRSAVRSGETARAARASFAFINEARAVASADGRVTRHHQ